MEETMHKTFKIYEGATCGMVIMLDGSGRSILCTGMPGDRTACDADDFGCIVLEKDARLNIVYIVMPGAQTGIDLSVALNGEGAEALVSGIYLCSGEDRVRIGMDIRHNVPHCISRQLFKGLVSGAAKVSFHGRITVAQDAQKTEAYQENHSIILSDAAKVDTKPQLEIYADDVKCSHGATVGRLNEEEQFYMRSRGIPEDEAKVLQMLSFLYPVLENVADSACREEVASAIDSAVRHL